MKSIQNQLQALSLDEKQCTHIMAPILEISLPKSAILQQYPRDVLYGPTEEGGLGRWNMYRFQGLYKISLMAEHLALQSMTGELLRCSIEAAKMEVGIGRYIFSLNYSIFGCLCADGLIKSIWKYAYDHDITVEDNVTANLQSRRQGDLYRMKVFGNEDRITSAMLQSINRCRLHMQVTTLANI